MDRLYKECNCLFNKNNTDGMDNKRALHKEENKKIKI